MFHLKSIFKPLPIYIHVELKKTGGFKTFEVELHDFAKFIPDYYLSVAIALSWSA